MGEVANYTTGVAAYRTRDEVERMLVLAGARGIATDYDELGRAVALAFVLSGPNGQLEHYRLPVRIHAMQKTLENAGMQARYRTIEHAERVAWRCIREWLRAQLTLAKTGLTTVDEIMLPHLVIPSGQTVYEERLRQIGPAS